ncbi:MAG: PAC2 family protein [Pirellulales bacterium]|nr:PAC2 family protein [Pirellulales bacterium]
MAGNRGESGPGKPYPRTTIGGGTVHSVDRRDIMHENELLKIHETLALEEGTLVLAFSGWMDGGDVSTGTVRRLVDLLGARPFAEINPEPFYIYNFPGTMEVAALFRPPTEIDGGLIQKLTMPTNVFYAHPPANLVLFLGQEPNLRWQSFGQCIIRLVHRVGVRRIVFVGSFGGAVPHTREPRLFVTCSEKGLLKEMDPYGVRRSGYTGPGSFTSYLLTEAPAANLQMISLAAEIPGYLQGTNPSSIEAVTRRLAKLLHLPLDLASLRSASTAWELQVSQIVEQDEELAQKVHELEEEYDNDLLKAESDRTTRGG